MGCEHFFKIMDRKSSIDPTSTEGKSVFEEDGKRGGEDKKPLLLKADGGVHFSRVSFSYPTRPDVNVLKGFDVKLNTGSMYAFVGESGCGKTSLMKLSM